LATALERTVARNVVDTDSACGHEQFAGWADILLSCERDVHINRVEDVSASDRGRSYGMREGVFGQHLDLKHGLGSRDLRHGIAECGRQRVILILATRARPTPCPENADSAVPVLASDNLAGLSSDAETKHLPSELNTALFSEPACTKSMASRPGLGVPQSQCSSWMRQRRAIG
jgi:hypothetical protein